MNFWSNFNETLKSTVSSSHNKSDNNKKLHKTKNNINSSEYSILDQNDNKYYEYFSDSDDEEIFQNINNKETKIKMNYEINNYNMRQSFENYSNEELVYSKKKIRNIRIILLVLGVLIIGALISVLVIFLTKSSDPQMPINKNSIHLDDILLGAFRAKTFNGSWSSGNIISYRHEDRLMEFDLSTQTSKILYELKDKYKYSTNHEKSADGKFLLFAREPYKIYRHSFSAFYDIVNLETNIITPIMINGEQVRLLLVKWSPVKNSLILNFNNNLYYKPSALDEPIKLTEDTDPRVINGIPDWVYEEEVFSSNEAIWFNPSGTKIAFVQFNDIPTHYMSLPFYGESGIADFQYPLQKHVPYPKSGSSNPFVKLFQMDLKSVEDGISTKQPIPVPSALNTDDHLITIVDWLNDDLVMSIWMNRIQNEAYIQVTSEKKKRYEVHNIKSKTGWVDLFKTPIKNRDGNQIALILPQNQGNDIGDYRHLALLTTKENGKPITLTHGKYVVQSILFWDYETNIIFYMANQPDQSQRLHLFAIKAVKGEQPQCITCSIKEDGVSQTYFSAEFSNNGKYILISSLGPSVPRLSIYQWSINNGNISLKKIMDWETNDNVRKLIETKYSNSMPTTEIHTIDIGDGFTAKVLLKLPPNLDRSGAKKYPLLVDVYGGPDSYSVVNTWGVDWGSFLASNLSIIYAKIDGRGSGLRGDKLLHSIYLSLGTSEVNDQINVTRKLQENIPFIDGDHSGIWGWSYGGYASGMALAKDNNNVFRCAASVAPVTDWLYYDSIYTERYMQTPEQNPVGYENGRLTTLAEKFNNKNYLLIHGTLDDNVHYQQSMVLIKNLERNDILFKQISYADEDHGLGNVRPHLYHSLTNFFSECFEIEKRI